MELDIAHQIYQTATAWLLGIFAGFYYDVLKTLRRRFAAGQGARASRATLFFDALFWLGLALAIFGQTMTAGGGSVRIFMLVVNLLGALVYFRFLSPPTLAVLGKLLDVVLKFLLFISFYFEYF